MKYLLPLVMLTLALPSWAAPDFPAMNTYVQTVEIKFRSPEAARRARLKVAPLYRNFSGAFSSRWDDNHFDDLKVAEVMKGWGQKGTFYLNDPAGWHDPGKAGKTPAGGAATALPKALVSAGHSIGDHTMHHDFLPALSRNKAFEEILSLRVEREVTSQSPVVCFTYPFVQMRSETDPDASQADLDEMLLRSGIYFLAENEPTLGTNRLLAARFVCLDGTPTANIDPEAEKDRKRGPEDWERPLFLSTMHAWADSWGGSEFPRLADLYRRWSGSKNLWYCNQNQYAAYRAQAIRTRVETRASGSTLTATVVRPEASDLGDPTPLSFLLENVRSGEALAVTCPGAKAVPFSTRGRYGFDLLHDDDKGMPEVYAKTDNPHNLDDPSQVVSPEGVSGVRALLRRKDGFLVLSIRNRGALVLHDIRVTFRLPLQWENEPAARRIGGLAPGGRKEVKIELKKRSSTDGGFRTACGTQYLAAQVDFSARQRVRLYATCRVPEEKADPAYPRDGFKVLGPLPADRKDFDFDGLTRAILKEDKLKSRYDLFEGVSVAWKTPPDGEASNLDPEIAWTTGKSAVATFYTWDPAVYCPYGKDLYYVLAGRVYSSVGRMAYLESSPGCLGAWSVNGKIADAEGARLSGGWNDLRVLYRPVTDPSNAFSPHCYGAFLRLNDGGGKRLSDLRFERPGDFRTAD